MSRSRRFGDGLLDGLLVISWKTIRLTGTLRLQHLEQVPRDRLALAVLVGREVELVRVLERRLQLPTTFFFSGTT